MANGPPEGTGPWSARRGDDRAGPARGSGGRRAAAGATAAVLLGLVACDVWVPGVRTWWDRHSFTSCVVSSLLVLGVTVLIIDEVLARRQRKDRAGTVAVQALILYGQALRSCDAVMGLATGAALEAGGGGPGAVADAPPVGAPQVDVRGEVRSLATMILVASPALFDDPEARLFLEEVQRLAGTMYGALARSKIRSAPPKGATDGTVAALGEGRSKINARVGPLAARLPAKDRASLEALADLARRPVPTGGAAQEGTSTAQA